MRRALGHRPALRALAGTLLGNVPGFVLPFCITAAVGAGRLTDAYFSAFAIALFASAVVSLALEANVLPAATHHLRHGPGALQRFARRLLVRAALLTAGAYAVAGGLGAAALGLRGSWTGEQRTLCAELIAIFAVYLLAVATTAVLAGCLYACGTFFLPTLTIGIRSLLPLPVLVLAAGDRAALLGVAVALAAGELLRALALGARLRAALAAVPAVPADPPPAGPAPRIWATTWPYALAMSLFAANQVVDRLAAGSLAPGSVTTLDLAEKVFYAPVTILMSSVLLVSGARWAALSLDRPGVLAADFGRTLRRSGLVSAGVAAVVIPAAILTAALVDRHVAGVDVPELCLVLAILMAGFPAAVMTNAGVRLLTVLGRTRIFPLLGAVALAADVAGAFAGAAWLGVAGIALSGTVWRTLNLLLFLSCSAAALRPTDPAPSLGVGSPIPLER